MDEQQYVSIKEFARRVGVSPQAIYKRLNQVGNRLNNYIKLVGNQRMLNIQALQDVYGIEVVNENQPVEKPDDNLSQPEQGVIEVLREQLRVKDEQMERELQVKNEQIRILQQQLREESERHHAELQRAQENLEREQQLHLLSQRRVLELEGQMNEPAQASTPDVQGHEVESDSNEERGTSWIGHLIKWLKK